MYKVRIEADFAAAHWLKDYHGKCENLHGHNYRVLVYAKGESLGEGGMLLDFGIIKKTLKKILDDTYDHKNLNDDSRFMNNPSAERIAKALFDDMKKALPDAPIYRVDVYETQTSRASYYE